MTTFTRHRPAGAAALLAGLLALGTALGAAPARAQLPLVPGVNPFSFGVEAGPAFPVGQFGDMAKAGFTADALLEARIPVLPVGLRVEGGYSQFSSKAVGLGTWHAVSGSADVVLRASPVALSLVRPYLLGGLTVAHLNNDGGTKAGYNLGAGLAVPLAVVTVFGDLRYTHVGTAGPGFTTVPLRVGVRF